jgi:hypothetical protein
MKKNKKFSYQSFEKETAALWKKANAANRRELLALFNHRLAFLQHERLAHLLVTLFFGGASLFLGWAAPESNNVYLPIIFIIVLVITLAYVGYYYYIENTCQRWQSLSLKMGQELLVKKKEV